MADVANTESGAHSRTPQAPPELAAAARRRRRNELRRASRRAHSAGGDALPPPAAEAAAEAVVNADGGDEESLPVRRNVAPVAGAMAVSGRQRKMEDAVAIWMDLCSPLINRSLPVHFFGVYDGHGGSHFSTMCKQKMHEIVKEELAGGAAGAWGRRPTPGVKSEEVMLEETWKGVMNRVFTRTEMVALSTCVCGSEGFHCSCSERRSISFSGTTAVVVVLTENHLVVGNCGDSRAVLCRAGAVVPLTVDHKPDRPDEKARIEASGGHVVNTDTARVQGILAMSRAIGDVFLKPLVISEPDVRITKRTEEDEFIIIASDGMWDVIPNDMAARVTRQCLKDPPPHGCRLPEYDLLTTTATFPCRSASAASLLTRLALARSSLDNISVVVIDLKGRRGE